AEPAGWARRDLRSRQRRSALPEQHHSGNPYQSRRPEPLEVPAGPAVHASRSARLHQSREHCATDPREFRVFACGPQHQLERPQPLTCQSGLENLNRIPPIDGLGSPFGDIYGLGQDKSLVLNFADHVSILRNKHSFKTGFEFRRGSMTRYAANYPGGRLTFGAGETVYGFTAFLLGDPTHT